MDIFLLYWFYLYSVCYPWRYLIIVFYEFINPQQPNEAEDPGTIYTASYGESFLFLMATHISSAIRHDYNDM